eukprot:INCI14118.1.p1 GENE.INCI14118.1~~INCI14118.1.p1  ORF type:complete len:612 (+),score=91.51 INCI14118.1:229-1836(+)
MYNVVVHGVAFMVIFSAFQTASEYAQPILEDQGLGDLGFESAAVIYLSLAGSNLAAPSVVSRLGAQWGMIAGATLYLVYLSAFLAPTRLIVLAASVVLGFGGATLWAAQGVFLIENSDPVQRGRDSGIFWSLLQCRLLIGNGVAFFTLGSSGPVSAQDAHTFFVFLLLLGVVGVGILFCLRPRRPRDAEPHGRFGADNDDSDTDQNGSTRRIGAPAQQKRLGPRQSGWGGLRVAATLLTRSSVQKLIVCFCYTGFVLTFWSGKYFSLMAGHSNSGIIATDNGTGAEAIDSAAAISRGVGVFGANAVAIGGVCLGVGEILGGFISGTVGDMSTVGRNVAFGVAVVCHIAAMALSFIVFSVPSWSTGLLGFAGSSSRVAAGYVVGALLGFGDAGLNTAIYALLGDFAKHLEEAVPKPRRLPDDVAAEHRSSSHGSAANADRAGSVPLIALFKLVQSSCAAIAFFYSGSLDLGWQILIVVVFGLASVVSFVMVNIQICSTATEYQAVTVPVSNSVEQTGVDLDAAWAARRHERLEFLS